MTAGALRAERGGPSVSPRAQAGWTQAGLILSNGRWVGERTCRLYAHDGRLGTRFAGWTEALARSLTCAPLRRGDALDLEIRWFGEISGPMLYTTDAMNMGAIIIMSIHHAYRVPLFIELFTA